MVEGNKPLGCFDLAYSSLFARTDNTNDVKSKFLTAIVEFLRVLIGFF